MALHDEGMLLSETQRRLTPVQRFVYVMAKDHWTPDDAKNPPKTSGNPSGMNKGKEITKGW